MADDIDLFLQKVESQLFNKNTKVNNVVGVITTAQSLLDTSSFSDVDPEVSQLLADIDTTVSNPPPRNNRKLSTVVTQADSTTREEKCFPLLLGAVDKPTGRSTVQNPRGNACVPRSCDSLRCTSCDRSVVAMSHSSWHPDADALFLRQAAVQPSHLNAKLDPQEGARAYACQCQCLTVTRGTQPVPQHLPWVCGKHAC